MTTRHAEAESAMDRLRADLARLAEDSAKRDVDAAKRDKQQLLAIAGMLALAVAILGFLGN